MFTKVRAGWSCLRSLSGSPTVAKRSGRELTAAKRIDREPTAAEKRSGREPIASKKSPTTAKKSDRKPTASKRSNREPTASKKGDREPQTSGREPKQTGERKPAKRGELVIRRHGEFLYGVAPCTAALLLKRRKLYAVYQKQGHIDKKTASKRPGLAETQVRKIAEEMKADYRVVDKSVLTTLCGNKPHQGIVLDVAPLNFRRMDIADCKLSKKEFGEKPMWVLLDEIQDPMNLGAILRSCYYLGVKRVITSLKRCCPLSPVVSKASAGAMEHMPVYSVSHLEQFLKEARANGWSVLGSTGADTDQQREETLPSVDCREYVKIGPTLLVLGNEGHGLHREVERQCEVMVRVEPHRTLPHGFDSLNVAVATGVLLHSLQRQSLTSSY